MKVCIAEKPSVAREIASIVGAQSRRDGYFEGNGYQVTWTFGHLCTLKEPHNYKMAGKSETQLLHGVIFYSTPNPLNGISSSGVFIEGTRLGG